MSRLSSELRKLWSDAEDLLDRHESSVDLEGIRESYRDDPVGFASDVLGAELWSGQRQMAEAVRDHRQTVVRSAHAIGKDFCAARLALWWAYAVDGLVILTGPTERQVTEILMKKELARAFRISNLPGDLYTSALRISGEEASVLAMTSTEASSLTGFHAHRVLVVISEAQSDRIESFAWDAMLSCATGPEDRILAYGNPIRPTGRFYEFTNSAAWHDLQYSTFDHPNLREGRQIIPGGPSVEWVDAQRKNYGEGSPFWVARVLGEFPEEALDALCARSWLEGAAEPERRNQLAVDEEFAPDPIVAVDPARLGGDQTAVAVMRGPVVEEIHTWGKSDSTETTGRIVQILREVGVTPSRRAEDDERLRQELLEREVVLGSSPAYGPRWSQREVPPKGTVVVDVPGLGGPIHDRLQELGYRTRDFNGGANPVPAERERFRDLKAASFWHLRRLLEDGEIALPRDRALFEELTTIQWSLTSKGRVMIEAKDDLRPRLGRSPDRADAVSMVVYTWHRQQTNRYNAAEWTTVKR